MADDKKPDLGDEDGLTSRISLKALAGIVTALGTIIGGVFIVDERYVHSETFDVAQATVELKVDQSVLDQRQWLLNDRISNLELKSPQQRSDYESAQLERYKRDLEDVNKRMRDIEKDMRRSKK